MKKVYIYWLVECFFFGIIFIFILFSFSKKNIFRPNGFKRIFWNNSIKKEYTIDLEFNSFYPAGATKNVLYFANSTAPSTILAYNFSQLDTYHVKINTPMASNGDPYSVYITIDSPFIYFTNGQEKILSYSTFQSYTPIYRLEDSDKFSASVPVSPRSFVLRNYDVVTRQNVISKWIYDPQKHLKNYKILEKQIDGVFCTDGMLFYEARSRWLIYGYHYRNQFIVFDTLLNILYRANTIDTNTTAKIKVAEIVSSQSRTMASPPPIINGFCSISANKIFINSRLIADNETPSEFQSNVVIDVYSLEKGNYLSSFYIPLFEGLKLNSYKIYGNRLVCMFDRYAVIYRLTL